MSEQPDNSGNQERASLDYLEVLHRRIEERAAGSDWEQLEALMSERDALLGDFHGDERETALRAAHESTERILKLAETERLDVVGKLAELRRGRKAANAYRAHR